MQRDKLTADPKYFITCLVHSTLIVQFDTSFNQHQHGNNLSALNTHMTIWKIVRCKTEIICMYWTEEGIKWKKLYWLLILIKGAFIKSLKKKERKEKVMHDKYSHQNNKLTFKFITWGDRSYTSATSEKWCHKQNKHLLDT